MQQTSDSYSNFWKNSASDKASVLALAVGCLLVAAAAAGFTARSALDIGFLPSRMAYPFFATGFLCLFWAPTPNVKTTPCVLTTFLAAALMCFVMSTEYRALGTAFLLSGVAGFIKQPRLSQLRTASLLALTACSAGVAASTLFNLADAHINIFQNLAPFISILTNLMGIESHAQDGVLFLHWGGDVTRFLCAPDKSSWPVGLLFIAGLCACLTLLGEPPKKSLTIALLWLLYSFILQIGLALKSTTYMVFPWWDELYQISVFLPFALSLPVLVKKVSLDPGRNLEFSTKFWMRGVIAASLVVLGCSYTEIGTKKAGRIVIDEHFSDWEWSDDPLNTVKYGVKTTYSYYCMIEELKRNYGKVERNYSPITLDSLKGVSVLILKTPTKEYPPETVNAIEQYVREGGSVWLVGDHTDVFGMTTYLNQVANKFGCKFEVNAVIDPETNRELYEPTFETHPVMSSMPPFLWYTGCSVQTPIGAHAVVRTKRLLVDEPDFSTNTFFGNFGPDWFERIGSVDQVVALEYGKGRVALWSDSTLFSNFAIYLPGKTALVNGTIQWLNRSQQPFRISWILIGFGIFVAVFWRKSYANRGAIWIVATGMVFGQSISAVLNHISYPQVPDRPAWTNIAFYDEKGDFHVPVLKAEPDNPDTITYLTTFIDAMRTGGRPYVCQDISELGSVSTAVVIHGHQIRSKEDVAAIDQFVQKGGTLLLVDYSPAYSKLLSAWVARAGITFLEVPAVSKGKNDDNANIFGIHDTNTFGIQDSKGTYLGKCRVAGFLTSENTLLANKDNPTDAVMTEKKYGRGRVVVSSTQSLFSDVSIGRNSDIPNDRQNALRKILMSYFPAAK